MDHNIASQDHYRPPRSSSPTLAARGSDSDETVHDQPTFQPITTNHHRPSTSSGQQRRGSRRLSRSGSLSNQLTRQSTKETRRDPNLDPDSLPYRTLSANANFDEFTTEHPSGTIKGPVVIDPTAGKEIAYKLVTFVPDDPENPKNWSKAYKWYVTMIVAITCFVVAFASSVVTADLIGVEETFNVSEEVALLTITVFVVGFGVGPVIFAPLSEIYGRRVIYGSTLLLAVIFIIPEAVSKNIATLIVCRAIDGIAFSAPMTLVGGTLADLWRNEERGVPMAAFSAAPFIGPAIGPLVGGYLSDAAGWRWLYWIQLILAFIVWVLITFTVPETYAPTILGRRAKKMRKETGSPEHVTEQDLDMRPLTERLSIFLIRPLQLLFGELIVFLISLYMSVLYGLLYMFFVAFPIIYQEGKGWSAGSTGLMFVSIFFPLLATHYIHTNDNSSLADPSCAWCHRLRSLLAVRKQTLPPDLRSLQRQAPRRIPPHPHDGQLLVHSHRPAHLRLDLLPTRPLDRSCARWLLRRVRLHLPLQCRQQLPRRLVPAPSRLCPRRQDFSAQLLGCGGGAVHRADVCGLWIPMGVYDSVLHGAGVLWDPVPVLEVWC